MNNIIQFKRRNSGVPGGPANLKSGEVAMNFVDDILYIGKGDDGLGNATSVVALAGIGNFIDKNTAQTISGHKTFSNPVTVGTATAGGHATTKTYVDDLVANTRVYDPGTGILIVDDVIQIDPATVATLNSPSFTGAPLAPTAAPNTNTTQIATTAFVKTALDALIGSAPGTLDTLNELAAALGDDPNFASTITTSIASKLSKDQNLADLTNVVTARANLGLGSLAVQNADDVNITGGTLSGVSVDAGSF